MLGSIAFAGIPLTILLTWRAINWIGWASLAFGIIGLIAVVARRLLGWTRAARPSGASCPTPRHDGPAPELSPSRQVDTRRVVRVMAQAGVFSPAAPDPTLLYAGLAEMDWSVKPDAVLLALGEASYYHPGFDAAAHMGNLALHETQVEQLPATIERHIRDLERLSAGAIHIDGLTITQADAPDLQVRSLASMQVNGVFLALDHVHPAKAMDGFIHDALASRMPPERRFAWLWVDQGAFVTALEPGAVEAMNEALKLGPHSRCQWEWIAPPGEGH